MSHLRHKTLEPNAILSWTLIKPERRGQFEAMLDFLGLRKSFDNPCGTHAKPKAQYFEVEVCYCSSCCQCGPAGSGQCYALLPPAALLYSLAS
jgi:hypothetical protein